MILVNDIFLMNDFTQMCECVKISLHKDEIDQVTVFFDELSKTEIRTIKW